MEQQEFEFMQSPVTRYDIFTDTQRPVNGTDLSVLLEINRAYAEIRYARQSFPDTWANDALDDIHMRLLKKVAEINGTVRPR